MGQLDCKKLAPGLYWVSIPSRGVFIQCGCPADSVKHLIKHGLIRNKSSSQTPHETGPNCLLLADLATQNGLFANLAEFSILQMFYRQGMIVPMHPGFSQEKPVMIGNDEQIKAQLNYVFRGNYGLISEAEILEAGLSATEAAEMMRIKRYFAFGQIKPSDSLLDARTLEAQPIEIKNGVYVQRLDINRFEIRYGRHSCVIDLNLEPHESFQPTYKLAFQRFAPEFFSVIHSGEGDGWDIHRPAMASIICYGPEVYLIDAGPHISHTLRALGLSLNSVRGIFHTHAHDDHFAGITELMRGDRKLEYFATRLVRHSVNKKLQALLNVNFPVLERFFNTHDLNAEKWNNINGLEVFPSYSPHPVETNTFKFRVVTENGYRSYHHLADIASLASLQKMVEPDTSLPGLSTERYQQIVDHYFEPADLKKIDNGGGLIHGQVLDFKNDPSKKIILAHNAEEPTADQLKVGIQIKFGEVDHLVKAYFNNRHEVAARSLHHYFPSVPFGSFYELLNQPIEEIEPGHLLCSKPVDEQDIFLILSGIVYEPETADSLKGREYAAGYLVGDDPNCHVSSLLAKSFVDALRIPRCIFEAFLERYHLKERFTHDLALRRLLQDSELFQGIKWSPLLNKITRAMRQIAIKDQQVIENFTGQFIFVLATGRLELFTGLFKETLYPGQFCYEDNVLSGHQRLGLKVKAMESATGYLIPHVVLREIPAVEWKLLETYKHRSQKILKLQASKAVA